MIGIGFAGCGSIALKHHIPEFSKLDDCRIIGYYNPSKERCQQASSEYGGIVFSSYEEMLLHKDIDAICICTPNKLHAQMALKAFEYGKHVLCEKPIASSVSNAKLMLAAAKDADRCLMTAHNMKYSMVSQKAKELLKSGQLGNVLSFQTSFGHSGPEFWSVNQTKESWFYQKEGFTGGVLSDLGIHKAQLISWLFDDPIAEVSAYQATRDKKDSKDNFVPVSDNCVSILRTKSGIIGTMSCSWTYYSEMDESTRIYCSEGSLELYTDKKYPLILRKRNGEEEYFEIPDQCYSSVAQEFIRAIQEDRSPETETHEGLHALQVVEACAESSKLGKSVTLPT